jgi:hypothetical protein
MPRAVDLLWRRGSGPAQCDKAGETLPVPFLHFALPLDNMEAARAPFAITGNMSLAIGSTRERGAS